MSYRFMRIMIFFDLPVNNSGEIRNYRRFHSFLEKEGFIRTQYSVYSKIVLNASQGNLVKEKIRKNAPPNGLVQCLMITERQFSAIDYFTGERQTKIIDCDSRWIKL